LCIDAGGCTESYKGECRASESAEAAYPFAQVKFGAGLDDFAKLLNHRCRQLGRFVEVKKSLDFLQAEELNAPLAEQADRANDFSLCRQGGATRGSRKRSNPPPGIGGRTAHRIGKLIRFGVRLALVSLHRRTVPVFHFGQPLWSYRDEIIFVCLML
jgi:hypothetical protein